MLPDLTRGEAETPELVLASLHRVGSPWDFREMLHRWVRWLFG